jgi:hypothetical protein
MAVDAEITERRARNAALVFDSSKYEIVQPFFTVPSWWRRFMFVVLSTREITLYTYICSWMDENYIAYPTYENIKADLNISNRSVIARTLSNLVNKGFLLINRDAPFVDSLHPQNVFQRPSQDYTLWTLLTKGYIDGNLRALVPAPKSAAIKKDNPGRNSGSIRKGLYTLLGGVDYLTYSRAPIAERGSILAQLLYARIEARRTAYINELAASASSTAPQSAGVDSGSGSTVSFGAHLDDEVPF